MLVSLLYCVDLFVQIHHTLSSEYVVYFIGLTWTLGIQGKSSLKWFSSHIWLKVFEYMFIYDINFYFLLCCLFINSNFRVKSSSYEACIANSLSNILKNNLMRNLVFVLEMFGWIQ